MRGKVAWFHPGKGFGFITPYSGGSDIFVHFNSIEMDGYKTLGQAEDVDFEIGTSEHNGKPMAVKVRKIGK